MKTVQGGIDLSPIRESRRLSCFVPWCLCVLPVNFIAPFSTFCQMLVGLGHRRWWLTLYESQSFRSRPEREILRSSLYTTTDLGRLHAVHTPLKLGTDLIRAFRSQTLSRRMESFQRNNTTILIRIRIHDDSPQVFVFS